MVFIMACDTNASMPEAHSKTTPLPVWWLVSFLPAAVFNVTLFHYLFFFLFPSFSLKIFLLLPRFVFYIHDHSPTCVYRCFYMAHMCINTDLNPEQCPAMVLNAVLRRWTEKIIYSGGSCPPSHVSKTILLKENHICFSLNKFELNTTS